MPFGQLSLHGRQPPLRKGDGSFRVEVRSDSRLAIVSQTDDGTDIAEVELAEHNVWALIGVLSLFVGLKLPAAIGRRIQVFGKPTKD